MRLAGKSAIVTGAGTGIGVGIALRLAQEGADVLVNYAHNASGAAKVVQQIQSMGRRAVAVKANVGAAGEVGALVDTAVKEFGRLDILVNNAGIDPHVNFLDMTEEQWDLVIDTNLKGNFLCSQAAARQMVRQIEAGTAVGGKIVIISSIHSIQTYPHITAYAATKGGLNAMTRQLALELAPYQINVNCVAPGAVHIDKFYGIIPDYNPHMFDHEIPIGFVGLPEDIAAAVSYFVSDEARYVTGQVLFVDGGTSCRLTLGVSDKKADVAEEIITKQKKRINK
jgi:NAD(P)-dependent dehydrogenase (short-subunit alcohol dehydrogenase family)